jgi:hypothetical protein
MLEKIGFFIFVNLLLWFYRPCAIGSEDRKLNETLGFLEKYKKYENDMFGWLLMVGYINYIMITLMY